MNTLRIKHLGDHRTGLWSVTLRYGCIQFPAGPCCLCSAGDWATAGPAVLPVITAVHSWEKLSPDESLVQSPGWKHYCTWQRGSTESSSRVCVQHGRRVTVRKRFNEGQSATAPMDTGMCIKSQHGDDGPCLGLVSEPVTLLTGLSSLQGAALAPRGLGCFSMSATSLLLPGTTEPWMGCVDSFGIYSLVATLSSAGLAVPASMQRSKTQKAQQSSLLSNSWLLPSRTF